MKNADQLWLALLGCCMILFFPYVRGMAIHKATKRLLRLSSQAEQPHHKNILKILIT
jgi:hypothetical protein